MRRDPLSSSRHTSRRGMTSTLACRPLDTGEAPTDYSTGRVCGECGAHLRRTNPGPNCSLHTHVPEEEVMHFCGYRFKVCERCDEVRAAKFVLEDGVCSACHQHDPAPLHRCTRCGKSKPANAGYWSMRKRPNGPPKPQGWCRACRNEQRRERLAREKAS